MALGEDQTRRTMALGEDQTRTKPLGEDQTRTMGSLLTQRTDHHRVPAHIQVAHSTKPNPKQEVDHRDEQLP